MYTYIYIYIYNMRVCPSLSSNGDWSRPFFPLELEMSVVGIPHIFNSEVHDFEPSPNWSCFQLVPFALRSICGLLLFFLTSFLFWCRGILGTTGRFFRDSTEFKSFQSGHGYPWPWPSMAIRLSDHWLWVPPCGQPRCLWRTWRPPCSGAGCSWGGQSSEAEDIVVFSMVKSGHCNYRDFNVFFLQL